MALNSGDRIGPYEVVSALGAGGMGEVYRARDTKLDRDVALKILPESFAGDPDRLMRFEREAKTLAALNHPNIAAIYGIEDRALVMELVEGEDLAERLVRGAIPLDEALAVARQIADALEAAHEAGVIHRDLKPGNVKVRPDGTVKVLDFGLARAVEGPGGDSAVSMATRTSPALTEMGVILGTAAYMSPEQARGKAVDRRADIWAFGCVLFEVLTGRRAFEGSEVTDVLASVIKDAPSFEALPPDTPAAVRRLLRRCLEKDPKRRLGHIGDARLELDEAERGDGEAAAPAGAPAAPARATGRLAVLLAAAVVLTGAATLWLSGMLRPEIGATQRLTVLAPEGQSIFVDSANVAISPDGRYVAYVTGSSFTEARLWIRRLDDLGSREVDGAIGASLPFWSRDSRTVGFFAGGKLMTAPVEGGRPQTLAEAPDARGATWSADGVIVFAPTSAGPLARVSSNGGAVTPATTLASDAGETGHRFPSFLPDGRHFMYAALPATGAQYAIFVGALDSTDREPLLQAETTPVYAAPGYLIYSRQGVLVAHPFDASRRALAGEAVPLGDTPGEMGLNYAAGWAAAVSTAGDLAYLTAGRSRSRLVWLDRTGREIEPTEVPAGPYLSVSVSGDGRRAALSQLDGSVTSVWLADLERGGLTPVSTRDEGWNGLPAISPDGRSVAFSSDRDGPVDLYLHSLDAGVEEPLYQSTGLFKHVAGWSPDGRQVIYGDLSPETDEDLWTIRVDGDRTPTLFLRTPGSEGIGAISPDGRWMAYISDQAGTADVYVQAFPGPGATHRITTGGALDWGLWWNADGTELLMLDAERQILSARVRMTPEFTAGAPQVIGALSFFPVGTRSIDATPDLQRLLAIVPAQADGSRSLTVVQRWQAAVGSRVP